MNGAALIIWPFAANNVLKLMLGAVNEPSSTAEQLARQAQAGCAESFERLVTMHEARIFNYLCQMTGNVHDAQDLTQVTFVKAYRSLSRFDTRLSFTTWLFTIAKRTALNHFRDARPTEEWTADQQVDVETPAVRVEASDEQESVWTLARRLPREQFEALWLRYGEGFSAAEIARATNTNQVRVRLHRARAKLAKLLRPRQSSQKRNV